MTEGQVLKEFIDKQRKSKQAIADGLNITRTTLYQYFDSQILNLETKEKLEKFFNTQIFTKEALERVLNEEETVSTDKRPYIEQRRQQKVTKKQFMVPLVPVKAQAGYVRAVDQERFIDTMEEYALPPGVNPQGAVWRYWEVEGESMSPTFNNGDIILTSQVHQMDWEQLRNFYLYVIVTNERVLFKRLFCKNALEWVLISENEEEYPQQLLPAESVKEVWVYRRSIVNKAPPIKMFEIKV